MKIAVMGAGAVGCYYGGMLARAGHDVTLIGRQQHVEAILRDGLLMDTQCFREHVLLQASTEAGAVKGATLVLFCVKSTDTISAAAEIAPFLEPDALILSLQNGVDNAATLAGSVKNPALPVAVYVATEMAGPGHLKHHGRGELVIGPSEASPSLVKLFSDADIPTSISDNVPGALWAKLALNCAYNALSAITQLPYRHLMAGEGIENVMKDLVDECVAVAAAEGISIPGDLWESVKRIAQTVPDQYSSTAQDLARGKRSEIDFINGHVMRRGQALGVPTPVNRTLYAIVKLLENKA